MNNKFLSFSFCIALLIAHITFAMEEKCKMPYTLEQERAFLLSRTAERYREFLSEFGKENPENLYGIMHSLFAEDVIKKVNTDVVCTTVKGLFDQIAGVKAAIKTWKVVEESPFLVSPEQNRIAVHYQIPTTSSGTIYVMKFLMCDAHGLIKEIKEIFITKL